MSITSNLYCKRLSLQADTESGLEKTCKKCKNSYIVTEHLIRGRRKESGSPRTYLTADNSYSHSSIDSLGGLHREKPLLCNY